MKTLIFWFGLLLVLGASARVGAQNQTTSELLPFNVQAGETVVFLGDSITHQCLYTQYIENFFLTRYPERRIRFHNAGVSGDKVGDCLVRFEEDVASLNPDYVLVLLGMNDGQYEAFNPETVNTYQKGMAELLDKITDAGAKPIVLSPTMFDHGTANRRREDDSWRFLGKAISSDYNALMAYFGAWGLEEAARRQVPFVNLWGPLNEYTIAGRRQNPSFTMIDDAIHPQASGQLVMAFEILSQLGVERRGASSVVISKRGKRYVGARLKDLKVNEDASEISFRHTSASLPWVIPVEESTQKLKWELPSDGRVGYQLCKAGHKLSSERLKVVGLSPGSYQVEIDGQVIGQWNHIALGTKIEIQENEKTPQFQQALKVALMNQKRNDEIVREMRNVWGRIKGIRRLPADNVRRNDLPALLAKAADLAAQENSALDEIYQAAVPIERNWRVTKIDN